MLFQKGKSPWNKGTKGIMGAWNKGIIRSEEFKRKISESLKGKPSPNKGKITSNSYVAVHHWIRRYKKMLTECEICRKSNCRLEWANIDHTYKRNVEDWATLCASCHKLHDFLNNNSYEIWLKSRMKGKTK